MKTLTLLLATTLVIPLSFASPARAEPLVLSRTIVNDGYAKLRKYCDQHSRCWTEGHRNPLLQAYAFAPSLRFATAHRFAKTHAAMSAKAVPAKVTRSR